MLMVILGCSKQRNGKSEDIDALCDPNPRLAILILDREDKTDSALLLIRPLHHVVDSLALYDGMSLASDIYGDADLLDTAYLSASSLDQINSAVNKHTGYTVIFTEELKNVVPEDTIISLISEYKSAIEDYLHQHDGENAKIQNIQYSYNIQEKERLKVEKKMYIYMVVASISVIISIFLLAVILYNKFKNADTEASYATTINLMKESEGIPCDDKVIQTEHTDDLSEDIIDENKEFQNGYGKESREFADCNENDKQESLSEIKTRIMSGIKLSDDKNLKLLVNSAIPASPVYHNLLEKLKMKSVITFSEEDIIFKNLQELIESDSHGFLFRLHILTEGKVTPTEKRIAMLIKCGFSPLQSSILLGKEKNTISTHRRNLAYKITGHKKSDHTLDVIISSL